jgi:hypothetical protein
MFSFVNVFDRFVFHDSAFLRVVRYVLRKRGNIAILAQEKPTGKLYVYASFVVLCFSSPTFSFPSATLLVLF